MVTKRSKKSKSVKDLPARSVSVRQAKGVKGGIIVNYKRDSSNATNAGLLLPAVQKVHE
jgi:hypothetical protein